MRFIVLPLVKEGLNCGNDKCRVYKHMRNIVDPLIKEHDLHFDFSLMHTFGVEDMV
jgi:hypothetical protein